MSSERDQKIIFLSMSMEVILVKGTEQLSNNIDISDQSVGIINIHIIGLMRCRVPLCNI
jgi:hypothetical protein